MNEAERRREEWHMVGGRVREEEVERERERERERVKEGETRRGKSTIPNVICMYGMYMYNAVYIHSTHMDESPGQNRNIIVLATIKNLINN